MENSKQRELPSEKEVITWFRCETCNFRSETIGMKGEENTNNLAQEIINIEQIDGNATFSSSIQGDNSCSEMETNMKNNDQSENKEKEAESEDTKNDESEDKETENDESEDEGTESEDDDISIYERRCYFLKFCGIYERLVNKANKLVENPLVLNGRHTDWWVPGLERNYEIKLIMNLRDECGSDLKEWKEIKDCVHVKWRVEEGNSEEEDIWIQIRDNVNSTWKKIAANRTEISALVKQSKRQIQKRIVKCRK